MKNQFPLFLHLKNEITGDEALTGGERTRLLERIKELDEQGCSLVYALIRYYQIYELKDNVVNSPFGMKKIKNGYRFCIEDLPPLLQQLLSRFVEIHIQSQASRV
jgi:hypothetical protein